MAVGNVEKKETTTVWYSLYVRNAVINDVQKHQITFTNAQIVMNQDRKDHSMFEKIEIGYADCILAPWRGSWNLVDDKSESIVFGWLWFVIKIQRKRK